MKKAVALHYDYVSAPTISAKGSGAVAEKIMEIAEKNDIILHKSPELVEVLSRLELGEEIPENLYIAIAEVIAFAHSLKE